jgi:pantoate--beta-alanine ligase
MLIFTKIAELQGYLSQIKAQHKTVGFVPTMGALHAGHVSLIQTSKKQCDFTICSVFVNPTQFNDKSDLERYPRMPEKDAALLESVYCNALFMPPVKEMYTGNEEKADFDFGLLDKILEGERRPGHFNGVAQVVKRFFEIVRPDKAFFGSKDYQQVMIVKALVKQMGSSIEIVSCPILREPDGLAMSSRNALLNAEERKTAGIIPVLMQKAKHIVEMKGVGAARLFVAEKVSSITDMKLDYYEVCDAGTLEVLSELKPQLKAVTLIAVFVGKIRLIDNLILD